MARDVGASVHLNRHALPLGQPTSPLVSVVVPSVRSSYLEDCVRSLAEQRLASGGHEVLVVDNTGAGTLRPLVEHAGVSGLAYVHEPGPGLHRARHAGARAARGEIVVYVDDDVIALPGWLAAIVAPFADPSVGCAGGKVLPRWEAEPPPWWKGVPPYFLSLLDLGEAARDFGPEEGAHGCNMAVMRKALFACGGFNPDAMGDPRLIWLRGDGEIGLQTKLRQAGYRTVYAPGAVVHHRIPAARLTRTSAHRRAFSEGITDSYREVRRNPARSLLLRHGVGCSVRALRDAARSLLRRPDASVTARIGMWYWYGRAMHQLRVLASARLRAHVLRHDYFAWDGP